MKEKDFTTTGIKISGAYENDRNADNNQLFKDMIKTAFGVTDVIVAHHLVYVTTEKRDGFDYQVIEEIPSADTLIFDHDIAKKLWGEDRYLEVLSWLSQIPCEHRDEALAHVFYEHGPGKK